MKYVLCILLASVLTYFIVSMIFFKYDNFIIVKPVKFQTKKKEFTYTVIRAKGNDVITMERHFQAFKDEHPEHKKLKLYRTTPINYFRIGEWIEYKANPSWQYPKLRFWHR